MRVFLAVGALVECAICIAIAHILTHALDLPRSADNGIWIVAVALCIWAVAVACWAVAVMRESERRW